VLTVKFAYKILKEDAQGDEGEIVCGFLEDKGPTIISFHSMEGFQR